MSTDQPTIFTALNAVRMEIGAVGKGERNPQGGYNFRGIDAVVNAASPALIANGVLVIPQVTSYEYGEILVGKNRTPMGHAKVIVAYTFYGPTGDSIGASAPGEAFDSGDKATPKAMSVAFRTALLQALTLPTHEVDVDATNYQRAEDPGPYVNQETGEVRTVPQPDEGAQRRKYHAMRERLGWDEDAGHDYINDLSKGRATRWSELNATQRSAVLDGMQDVIDGLGPIIPKGE